MQTRLAQALEVLANLALIVAALLFGAVLIRSLRSPTAEKKTQSTLPPVTQRVIQKGQVIGGLHINPAGSARTLLLALSTTCHFCTDSASFYQRISTERGHTYLVAIFPQEPREGERYLANLGVKVDEVKQVAFGELGITGTPTLALIDSEGKVLNIWEGLLPSSGENEVIERMKQDATTNHSQ
jgi:hypothetical protein